MKKNTESISTYRGFAIDLNCAKDIAKSSSRHSSSYSNQLWLNKKSGYLMVVQVTSNQYMVSDNGSAFLVGHVNKHMSTSELLTMIKLNIDAYIEYKQEMEAFKDYHPEEV